MKIEKREILYSLNMVCLKHSVNQFSMIAYGLLDAGFDINMISCYSPKLEIVENGKPFFMCHLSKDTMEISLESNFVNNAIKLKLTVQDSDCRENIDYFVTTVEENLAEFESYHIEQQQKRREQRALKRTRPNNKSIKENDELFDAQHNLNML